MTAGKLPATMHRVVIAPDQAAAAAAGARAAGSSSSRLSLCFKLHAAPDALLSPAQMTGKAAECLAARYRVPKTAKQLLEEFDAAHTSIHSHVGTRSDQQQDGGQQHEQQQQPVAVQGAAETTACSAKRQDKDSSPDQVHKRQCLQHITHSTPVAGTQKQKDHQILDITCRNRMGEDVIFKVNWDCRLGKLMKAYSLMKPDVEWRFIFNGCLIDPNLTPWSYDMEDGDTIDVVQVQYGD